MVASKAFLLLSFFYLAICEVKTTNANSIRAEKDCFTTSEDISITVDQSDVQPEDFVAIYSPTVSLRSLPNVNDSSRWCWACESRNCSIVGTTQSSVKYFNNLATGKWKAVLAHNNVNGPPYVGVAESASFMIATSCNTPQATVRRRAAANPTKALTMKSRNRFVPVKASRKRPDWTFTHPRNRGPRSTVRCITTQPLPSRFPTRALSGRPPTSAPTPRPVSRATTNPTFVSTRLTTRRATFRSPTRRRRTKSPTRAPTRRRRITKAPTRAPTRRRRTKVPTRAPTRRRRTKAPTRAPTLTQVSLPTSPAPTNAPTRFPTFVPTSTRLSPTLAPTSPPTTSAPTGALTSTPTITPTRSPTAAPTQSPTRITTTPSRTPTRTTTQTPAPFDAQFSLDAAKNDVEAIILYQDIKLASKFIRLAFHDCVGGCDGCVDLTNPDNAGLLGPIEALRPIITNHVGPGKALRSRADVWALAATVAADVTQSQGERIDFKFEQVGRVNCENANTVCTNQNGVVHPCSDIRGPHRVLPSMNLRSRDMFTYFANNFGYNVQETVAIMGAHTLGELKKENSGVNGVNGWKVNNHVLDNGYFKELIGGTSATDSRLVHVDSAPDWTRFVETNNPNGIPDRNIWIANPGVTIVMLNADVALVRELSESNMDADGKVNCTFIRTGRCPVNNLAIQFAIDYCFDNPRWLTDFRAALKKMLSNGYSQTGVCDGQICTLQPN